VVRRTRDTQNGTLTRAEVCERLGVSLSTVRRWEGSRLHPRQGPGGVRLFDPAEVAALAAELANDAPGSASASTRQAASGARRARPEPPPERTPGELAALVFERLEQRQTLAEIVVGLRVPPALVRELHREWLVGLTEGELQRPEPLLPTDDQRRARERHVKADGLARLLADLPMNTRTRISLARDVGEAFFGEGPNGFPLEARNVVELGGFVVMGPIETSEIARRFGAGDFRITAYGFDPPGVRWEVFATISRETEVEALAAVDLPALPAPAPLPLPAGASTSAPADLELHDEHERDNEHEHEHEREDVAELPADWRGLRAELAAVLLPVPVPAAVSSAPRLRTRTVEELPAAWRQTIEAIAPGAFAPVPPGLAGETIAALDRLRASLLTVEPVEDRRLAAVTEALARHTADDLPPDPGEALAAWSVVRARADEFTRACLEATVSDADARRRLVLAGTDPDAVLDCCRFFAAMTCAAEIRKLLATSSVGAAAGDARRAMER
jgi:transcriptional regulator with XRE-family HTH domain